MFGENLKAARKEKGLTQEELAARLKVVRQTISKWEKGLSVPDADLLIRLSEILDEPVSKLLGAKMDLEDKDTSLVTEQLSRINEELAVRTRRTRRLSKTLFAVICSFFAYLIGAAIEISPSVNLPGFGIVLTVLTMGSMIVFHTLGK